MNVTELIAALQTMPADADVLHLWDGAARSGIKHVWLARNGSVVTADNAEVCYYTDDRPLDAPTSEQAPYWQSPSET